MGSYIISVRDDKILQKSLEEGRRIELDASCQHNSNVIFEILKHADKVMPLFSGISQNDRRRIADSVAYLLRPDLIRNGINCFGPMAFSGNPEEENKVSGKIVLKGDVSKLTPAFDLKEEELDGSWGKAQEFFRCYTATQVWMKMEGTNKTLGDALDPKHHSLAPAFKLTDLTVYLLDPNQIVDYIYTKEEISKYRKELSEDIRST